MFLPAALQMQNTFHLFIKGLNKNVGNWSEYYIYW